MEAVGVSPSAGSVVTHAGLVCLELYKVLQGKKVEDYRNTFANLAIPLFAMSEPVPPKTFKFSRPDGSAMEWSLWDRWILHGDVTVQQALDWFKVGGRGPNRLPLVMSCILLQPCSDSHRSRWILLSGQ